MGPICFEKIFGRYLVLDYGSLEIQTADLMACVYAEIQCLTNRF
jgi:hypothetical protein